MGLFSFLGHAIKDVAQVGGDVVTGNFVKAGTDIASDVYHAVAGSGRKVASPSAGSGVPNTQLQLPTLTQLSLPGSAASSRPPQFTTLQATLPANLNPNPKMRPVSGFFDFLKKKGVTGIAWDTIKDMFTHPFDSWSGHLQNLWNQYASEQTGQSSNLPALPGAPALAASPLSSSGAVKQVISHRAVKKGEVVVQYQGRYIAVPKEVARGLRDPETGEKLWRSTPKPALSHHDMKVAAEYKRVEKKLKTLSGKLDLKTEHKYAGRARDRRSKAKIEDAIIVKESK